jgi:uncharacterized membrane protein YccC
MQRFLSVISWRSVLFSTKSFVAAMLAVYVAFRLGLTHPSWSITTVYVVAQPFAGMVLAKSLFRIVGTCAGAVVSLLFVALFSNAPELFCLALALWMAGCTYVAIYLRDAPASYAAVLSGYSAAIIGLSAALAPNAAFDVAVARCLEIMLGIGCATLVHHLVLPDQAGKALLAAIAGILPDMARRAEDALQDPDQGMKSLASRRKVVSDVVALDGLRVFAVLDTPSLAVIERVVRRFEGQVLSLLAMFVSVSDRLRLLQREDPPAWDGLRPLLQRTIAHMAETAHAATPEEIAQAVASEAALTAEIEARLPPPAALRADRGAFVMRTLLLRLRDALVLWRESLLLNIHISVGARPPDSGPAPSFRRYRDHELAAVGAFIVAAAVLIASACWILAAWPKGPLAVTYAGVITAVLGARDDPVTVSAVWLKMAVVATAISSLYLFVVLPPLDTFLALVVALAPFYLVCGILQSAPATAGFALPLIFIAGGLMDVSNAMTQDFADFLNVFLAYFTGIAIAATTLSLMRPLGAAWSVRRLTRGIIVELAQLASPRSAPSRSVFESRMFDRINALLARLDPTQPEPRAVMQGSLASLRVGLNILVLKVVRRNLPLDAGQAVDAGLAALAAHFCRGGGGGAASPLPALEEALARVLDLGESAALVRAAEALYGIDSTIRQHPTFFALAANDQGVATTVAAIA